MNQHLNKSRTGLALMAVLISLSTLLSACVSHHGAARIVSDPPGATVLNLRDKTELGVTPLIVHFVEGSSERQNIAVRFKKKGYYNKTVSFWLNLRHSDKQSAIDAAEKWHASMQKIGDQAPDK